MATFNHVSVLLHECIEGLNIKSDGIYVDATMGGGGHSRLIAQALDTGCLIGFDQDQIAYEHNVLQFADDSHVQVVHNNFSHLQGELTKLGIEHVDGVLYDLGMSSMQIDEAKRGFSYMHDARLDMRMNQTQSLDAYQVVNTYSESELSMIFTKYGEEKFAKRIAHAIVNKRAQAPIETTLALVDVIRDAIPKKVLHQKASHPAKKVFQALRIYINDELQVLQTSLAQAWEMLNVGGRICVISFHSLEDKIVKQFFRKLTSVDPQIQHLPEIPEELQPHGKLITNKPIIPTDSELTTNSRSHSAKLRIIEKIK